MKKELITHEENEKRKTLELEHGFKMEEITLEKSLDATIGAIQTQSQEPIQKSA